MIFQKCSKRFTGKNKKHGGFRRALIDHIPRQKAACDIGFIPVERQRSVIYPLEENIRSGGYLLDAVEE